MPSTPEIKQRIHAHNKALQMQSVMDQAVCGWDFRFQNPADFNHQQDLTDDQFASIVFRLLKWFVFGLILITALAVLRPIIKAQTGI